MKAEQRKELETNALADRMGHLVQRVKTQPRRTALYYVIGAVALFLVMFVLFRWYATSKEEASKRWFNIYIGSGRALEEVAIKSEDTNQSKAALFEVAWYVYWEDGVKRLGMDGQEALQKLLGAASLYEKLAKECENDPIWEPEAMYALAVIDETRAVQNLDQIEVAKKRYEELARKHPNSARGELAKQWLDDYESPSKRKELTDFYTEMRASLNIPNVLPKKGADFSKPAKKDTKQK